jgi:2-oxoglutarate dehydrogenase E2 component (dihydrolipoamide succinyltransferase)
MSSSRTDATALVDVTMPQMGVSVAEGTVVRWAKQIGDVVQADETICEISTDKIDTEVPSPVSGVVADILVAVDTTVEVGVVLARVAVGADSLGGSGPPAGGPGGGIGTPVGRHDCVRRGCRSPFCGGAARGCERRAWPSPAVLAGGAADCG